VNLRTWLNVLVLVMLVLATAIGPMFVPATSGAETAGALGVKP